MLYLVSLVFMLTRETYSQISTDQENAEEGLKVLGDLNSLKISVRSKTCSIINAYIYRSACEEVNWYLKGALKLNMAMNGGQFATMIGV